MFKNIISNKHFVRIALVVVFVSVISFFTIRQFIKASTVSFSRKNVSGSEVVLKDVVSSDRDGDGLLDWEESLWGTSPDKSDTDGNGIGDKEDVEKRRQNLAPSTKDDSDLNDTEKFAREFFTTIIALQESGNLNETSLANIANQVTAKSQTVSIENMYGEDDIKTTESTGASLTDYKKNVNAILKSNSNENLGNELVTVAKALESDSGGPLDELKDNITAYNTLENKLSKLLVPRNLAEKHLAVLNSIYKTKKSVENLMEVINNPLIGMTGISQYNTYSKELVSTLTDLKNYLR